MVLKPHRSKEFLCQPPLERPGNWEEGGTVILEAFGQPWAKWLPVSGKFLMGPPLCPSARGGGGAHRSPCLTLHLQCPQDKDQEEGPKFQKRVLDPGIGAHATQDGERSQISFVLLKTYLFAYLFSCVGS